MYLRNSAKAIIVSDGHILCIKCSDPMGFYYLLPGGGQEPGEPLSDAVVRECREEIGADVTVGDLAFVRDYISAHHEFADEEPEPVHQVELMFMCKLVDPTQVQIGDSPDTYQIGVEWLPLATLSDYRLYPQALRSHLAERRFDSSPIYIGDVN